MKIRDRRKFICEVRRKTSKQTLSNTLIRGPPYNAYKNSKKIDNEAGYPPSLLSSETPKKQKEHCFDGRKLKRELQRKTSKKTLRNTFSRGPKKMKIWDRMKLICEVCRKTSTKTLWNTFIRGPKKGGNYYAKFVEKRQKDPQEYVYQGSKKRR